MTPLEEAATRLRNALHLRPGPRRCATFWSGLTPLLPIASSRSTAAQTVKQHSPRISPGAWPCCDNIHRHSKVVVRSRGRRSNAN